jgi:transcriptional regulator with XRE-family HTH domain
MYTRLMTVHARRESTVPEGEPRIGDVLKRLREQNDLSLRTLATRAGFSASFLSQLENGQVSPSIASLTRIASELGVTLVDLFEATQVPAAAVVRADARPGFTSSWSRARVESLTPSGERRPLEAVAVTLASGGASGKHPAGQATDQFAFVVKGPVTLFLGDDRLSLNTGDAAVIPRRAPHRWQNDSGGSTQVVLVGTRLSQPSVARSSGRPQKGIVAESPRRRSPTKRR